MVTKGRGRCDGMVWRRGRWRVRNVPADTAAAEARAHGDTNAGVHEAMAVAVMAVLVVVVVMVRWYGGGAMDEEVGEEEMHGCRVAVGC